jgi:hypothetical protein
MPADFRAVGALIVLLLSTSPGEMHAQRIADARLAAGVPVRMTTWSDQRESALFAGQSDSGLTIRQLCGGGCDSTSTIPWSELARVDARLSQEHSAGWHRESEAWTTVWPAIR